MSKEFKNMDDLFRAAFSNESAEAPAFVKENIDRHLWKRKRFVFWFLSSALFLICGVIAAIGLGLKHDHPNFSHRKTVSESSRNSSSTTTHPTGNKTTTFSETKSSASISDSESSLLSDKQTNSGSQGETMTFHHLSESSTTSPGIDPGEKNTSEINSETSGSSKTSLTQSGSDTTRKNYGSKQSSQSSPQWRAKTPESALNPSKQIVSFRPLAARLFEFQSPFQPINFKTPGLEKPDEITSVFAHYEPEKPIQIQVGESSHPWMITASGGVSFSQSVYQSTDTAEVNYYQSSTSPKPGFDAQLDLRYRLKNSLTFGTGIGFSKLAEDYHFYKESISVDSTLTWTYVYDSLDTLNVFPIDSMSTTNYDSLTVIDYNESGATSATYLHIPFSIGTQLIRNRFILEVFVAGRFNYLLNGSGAYVTNGNLLHFDKNLGLIFRSYYWDLYLGAKVHVQLYKSLYATGAFRFQPALGSIYQGISLERSVRSSQVNLGLSWRF